MEERICEALAPLGVPVKAGGYTGEEPIYISYRCSALPGAYGDDRPEFVVWRFYLDLFAPIGTDCRVLRKQIKLRVFGAGFTYPDEVDVSDSYKLSDAEQHYSFSCQIEEAIDYGEV